VPLDEGAEKIDPVRGRQLGTELLPLVEDRHEVLGLDLHNCDLTRRDQVLAAITSFRPDVVLHLAAYTAVDACETDVDTAYAVNALATRFIADGARRVGAHVVYVSTDYVFDGTKPTPYVEWDQPCPVSVYGRTKLAGELEIDRGWTIARTSWVAASKTASRNSVTSWEFSALRRSGRCNSIVVTASSRVTPIMTNQPISLDL